jgi:hypothetical protein
LKKITKLIITVFLVGTIGVITLIVGCIASESTNDISRDNKLSDGVGFDPGPAPNSGDGISDGSGFKE